MRLLIVLFAVLSLAAAVPAVAAGSVEIEKQPPCIQERYFDPENLPQPPPPVPPGLKAVTEYDYFCDAFCSVDFLDHGTPNPDGTVKAAVRVNSYLLRLTLTVTNWLPKGASQALQEHEKGHSQISSHVFEKADHIAEQIAKQLIGQTFEGSGLTVEEARTAAILRAAKAFCTRYHAQTKDVAHQMDVYYDQLTDHGRSGPSTGDALKAVFKKFKA